MKSIKSIIFYFCLSCAFATQAQLVVTISAPKVTAQKAIISVEMKNDFKQDIKSAKAALLLSDNQGKMIGQSSKWIIGGSNGKPGLNPGKISKFYFVITTAQPLTTSNLTSQVMFSRLILANGQLVDLTKDIQIQNADK